MPVDEHMPAIARLKDKQSLPELSSQMLTIITTEHYNLQMGRAMTVADSNGRSTLFIGAVSGALIAIAFTGQVSRMGTAFFVFSLESAPQLRPSFMLAADDESRRPTLKVGLHPSWWQVFLTTAGMIAAINSVLLGVFVGLLLAALFSFPLPVCTSAAVLTFLLSLGLHQRYQWGQWRRLEQDLAALAQARRK
jgi:hypothetical protein